MNNQPTKEVISMKSLTLSIFSIFCALAVFTSPLSGWASEASETQADALYAARGEDVQNAVLAAQMYGTLAEQTQGDDLAKAELLIKQAEAHYYIAYKQGDKKKIFKKGYKIAKEAVDLFPEPDFDQEEVKAKALYWYGANMARTLGLFSLGNVPKVMESMDAIEVLGYEDVYDYGPARLLGRLRF